MKSAAILASIGFLIMAVALAYGFARGDGWDEVRELMNSPWFVVSLVDVYVGFALFAFWVAYRQTPLSAALWIVPLFILGNAVACVYALLAAVQSRGDWHRFWLGRHAVD